MRCPTVNSSALCSFYSCADYITISPRSLPSFSNAYFRLYDSGGYALINFDVYGEYTYYNGMGCQTFRLRQACSSSSSCKNVFYIITNAQPVQSAIPTVASTGRSSGPISAAPTGTWQNKTFATYVDCGFFSIQNPNDQKPCYFRACGGTELSIVATSSNIYATLYSSGGKILAYYWGYYSSTSFSTPVDSLCQVP